MKRSMTARRRSSWRPRTSGRQTSSPMATLTPALPNAGPVFTFDAVAHQYFLDGVEIPGVTTILKTAGVADHAYGFGDAQLRGLHVHEACELLDLNDLDWRSVYPAWLDYVKAYVRFKDDTGFVPELIEYQTYHPAFRYGGTLDRRGTLNGQSVLIDLKTGVQEDWWAFQLAGYQLLGGHQFAQDDRYALQLKKDGTYKLHRMDGLADTQVFLAALTLTHYKW